MYRIERIFCLSCKKIITQNKYMKNIWNFDKGRDRKYKIRNDLGNEIIIFGTK